MGKGRTFAIVAEETDRAKLRNWIENAERTGAPDVAMAARRRLLGIGAAAATGPADDALALDLWRSILALEDAITGERGNTIRLCRTCQ